MKNLAKHFKWWVALLWFGCSNQASPVPTEKATVKEERAPQEFKLPDNQKSKPLISEETAERSLALGELIRYGHCHELFEPGGQPHDKLPFISKISDVIAGCDPENYRREKDGFYVAYGIPRDDGTAGRDLRLARYKADGSLVWTATQDRGRNAKNFVANYRGAFIESVSPTMLCTGTLWEGGTQTTCLNTDTGEPVWDGRIPAWSGIKPIGKDGGLYIADLTSMTKRYPFSGAEMKYAKLSGMGGRSGFYARDKDALFFVPSRSEDSVLRRYDIDTLKESWTTKLPAHPMSLFSHVADDVLVLKVDKTMYGIDTKDGTVKWGYEIGTDRPPVVDRDGVLYVLHRQPDGPNTVVAISLESGERIFRAPAPTGTLQLREVDGDLFLKGVRAIQRVNAP